jgi:ubiquinol-cytochrome c reductase cytochrome b subunit
MIHRFGPWLDERSGIPAAVRNFLNEEIPASSGWAQVFGSVALFLLLTQAFTGILLAFNFAPTPGDAYNSLKYILTEVTAGRMIHGLHHWGASMMIVVVVLHMAQVFLYGAYKRPREATWAAGVALLLITLAFGLTGYLLPWDNRAYWGTVVTTQIAGHAPLAGPYIERLLGADSGIGTLTYARFYALHTLVLPALAFGLVAFHLYLVRRHGVAPGPGTPRPGHRFYPSQAFKDACAMFAAFAILFVLAAAAEVPLERMADPTDSTYIPRPEWYFLFLFQTLKLFRGVWEQIGSVLLPTLAIALLFAVPFLDRAAVRRVRERSTAIAAVAIAVIGWTGLTAAAVLTAPRPGNETAAGAQIFAANGCGACHSINGQGGTVGPSLNGLSRRRSRTWVAQHLRDPKSQTPGTVMPAFPLSAPDRDRLIDYLFSLP